MWWGMEEEDLEWIPPGLRESTLLVRLLKSLGFSYGSERYGIWCNRKSRRLNRDLGGTKSNKVKTNRISKLKIYSANNLLYFLYN